MTSSKPPSIRSVRTPNPFRHDRLWGLLLISPWLIGVIVFKMAPIAASLVVSFTNYHLLEPGRVEWIGVQNYAKLLGDADFRDVLWQTLSLALFVIPLQTAASILLATLLSHKRLLHTNLIRSLFFLPSIIPSVAAVFVTRDFLDPGRGWWSRMLLGPLGLSDTPFLQPGGHPQTLYILTSLWAIGPGFLIILAALQRIPGEIHEAARLDGAGPIVRYAAITLPLVSPAVFFCLIINLTAVFGGAILLDRGSSLSTETSSLASYLHFLLFEKWQLGYASGVAWVFFFLSMLLVSSLFASSKRWVFFPKGNNE
jgi:multiple sugar transport system permease protein